MTLLRVKANSIFTINGWARSNVIRYLSRDRKNYMNTFTTYLVDIKCTFDVTNTSVLHLNKFNTFPLAYVVHMDFAMLYEIILTLRSDLQKNPCNLHYIASCKMNKVWSGQSSPEMYKCMYFPASSNSTKCYFVVRMQYKYLDSFIFHIETY